MRRAIADVADTLMRKSGDRQEFQGESIPRSKIIRRKWEAPVRP